MSVVAADLKAYQSASMPEDDVSTSGGAINTAGQVGIIALASNSALEVVSDNAGDTMNVTVTARDPAGAIVSETVALNGTTPVALTTLGTIERVEKVVLAAAAAGNVTTRVSGAGASVSVMPAGITSDRRMFYDAASQASQTVRYEKFFYKNTNGTTTLNSAQLTLTADPATSILIGAAPAVDDTGSVANRLTSPGVTLVDDNVAQAVPGGALAAGSAIGVWVQMTRAAAAAAIKDSFTVQLDGTTA